MKDVRNRIITNIIKPIERGEDDISVLNIAKELRDDYYAYDLFEELMPLYKEFLITPETRFGNAFSYSITLKNGKLQSGSCIKRLLESESNLPELFDKIGLIEMINASIRLSNDPKLTSFAYFFDKLIITAVKQGYETNWEELISDMQQRTRDFSSKKNTSGVEQCSFLAAIANIKKQRITIGEQEELLDLLFENWHILTFLLSIIKGIIIGCNFSHLFQIIPLFSDTYKEYSHLMLKCISYNPDVFFAEEPDKLKKRIKGLDKLIEVTEKTKSNQSIDQLFKVIFPNIEFDENVTKRNVQQILEELNNKYSQESKKKWEKYKHFKERVEQIQSYELIVKLKEQLKNSVSVEALANTILEKEPDAAEDLFKQLDWGLEGEPGWVENREQVKEQIKMKKIKEEERKRIMTEGFKLLQNSNTGDGLSFYHYGSGSQHIDNRRQLTINNPKPKQIEE